MVRLGLVFIFLSLAGIPPLGGFWAKLFLFQKIAEQGNDLARLLLIGGIANSALALYYYAKVGISAYMSSETGEISKDEKVRPSYGVVVVSGLSLVFILVGWYFLQPKDLTNITLEHRSESIQK